MQILIKSVTGRIITLEVEPTDTIGNVKQKIIDMEGVTFPDRELELIYNSTKLIDDKHLVDYNIQNECQILSVWSLKPIKGIIQLSIRINMGKLIYIDVDADDTIDKVKEIVSEKEGVPTDRLRVKYGAVLLHDHKTINDYHLRSSSMLNISISNPLIHLKIQNISDKTEFQLDAGMYNTIPEIKEKIEKYKRNIPPYQQVLIVNPSSKLVETFSRMGGEVEQTHIDEIIELCKNEQIKDETSDINKLGIHDGTKLILIQSHDKNSAHHHRVCVIS